MLTTAAAPTADSGWWTSHLAAGGGLVANLSFTDSSGDVSAWPVVLDTGSGNLAVSTAACGTCGAAFTTSLVLDVDAGRTIEVLYGDSKVTSSFWSGVAATSVVGFFPDQRGLGGCFAETKTLAAINIASEAPYAFFKGSPPFMGILGLGFAGVAQPFTITSSGEQVHAPSSVHRSTSPPPPPPLTLLLIIPPWRKRLPQSPFLRRSGTRGN